MYRMNPPSMVHRIRRSILTDVGTNNGSVRNEWILSTIAKIPAGRSLLDAGAGECQFKEACSHLKYTSQDFGQYDGSGDDKGIQMKNWNNSKLDIVGDITSIPVPDASFDVILCTEVFEHIPDPISAIKEFSRILKKDGQLILTAPFGSMTHFSPYHFYSGFNSYFYKTNLAKYGFTITELHSNGTFFDYVAQDIKTVPFAAKQYSTKKVGYLSKLIIVLMLHVLNRLKKSSHGSEDLLCFGYQVVAVKD